jgi:DNA-binding GntR family transcriptional regulator
MTIQSDMNEFQAEYPVSLVTQFTEFMINSILQGKVAPGARLVEYELQKRYRISRAVIRESFRILEQRKLLITVPRKGTFVREITRKDIEEIFPIRAVLEGLAAKLAMESVTNENLAAMTVSLSQMRQAAARKDFKSYLEYHAKYHEALIIPCGNDSLIELISELRMYIMWYRFSYLYVQQFFESDLSSHQEILDVVKGKDPALAEQAVRNHILGALGSYLDFLGNLLPDRRREPITLVG